MATTEQRWAEAERGLDVQTARRVRRTPGVVIGILALLVLAVGVTAAVDLRRLQTPRGASQAWTEAATFGDCRAYFALSRAAEADARSESDQCRQLRRSTADARAQSAAYSFTPVAVERHGRTATVVMRLRRPGGTVTAELHLVRRNSDWLVLREPPTCGVVGCP
ncbi:MAG: hypothetical protein QOE99_668 [Actinomycetota bacterium]|nr:hypothetical protein [Actinomycetota bacterium]